MPAQPTAAFRYRYIVLVVLTFCYAIQYFNRSQINTLMPAIGGELRMSEIQIGLGSALMLLFYGPSQWVTGLLCDRIGSKRILVFSIVAWSLMTAWMADMHSVSEWYFRMALFGALVGTELIPSSRLLVRWFPPHLRARAQSVLSWAWIVTPAWAPLASTAMYAAFGNSWRETFLVVAVAGAVPLVLILTLVVDRPEKCRFAGREEVAECYSEERRQGLLTAADLSGPDLAHIERRAKAGNITFTQILKTKGYLPLVGVVVIAQQVFWGVMVWSAKYLSEVHKFSMKNMGLWACAFFVGGAVGSFLSSWISDTWLGGRRRPMVLVCFACAIPFLVTLAQLHQGAAPWLLLAALIGAGFFSNMVWGPVLSMPADLFPAEVYGKAMGFTNCISYMAAAACPYIMGALIHTDAAANTKDYRWAWMYIAFAALVGVVIACFLVDKKPRSSQPQALAMGQEKAVAELRNS